MVQKDHRDEGMHFDNTIPFQITKLSTTSIVIDLSSNRIKGDIPVLPTSLTYFSIANNEFTGSIPSSMYSLDKLQILDMSNNKLSGIIPDIFPLNCNLKTLTSAVKY
uniref:Uncharacterized protein n=1 Tax=Solanum lycopersicum TaxID=4081 RepID=A0A3Q7IJT7_SOLLC